MAPAEIRINVETLPPAKNEALSLFSEKHGQRDRVVALLRAARAALPGEFVPFGGALHLDVVLRRPDGSSPPDATNLLGGIGDVLESKERRRLPSWIEDFGDVAVFRNDSQIRRISYREESAEELGYTVRIGPLPT